MITAKALESYLEAHTKEGLNVIRFKRTFPGISRETYLVWATTPAGAERNFIFRTDSKGGPICPVDLEFEWQVMRHLYKTDVPVAEPLWFDPAPELTDGNPLMVRVMVDGSNEIPGLYDKGSEADARRQRVANEHAAALATLHKLDIEKEGFTRFMATPPSPEQASRHDFDRWTTLWRELRTDPMPLMTEAAHWLQESLPTEIPRLSLCKGNNGMGEEIWKDEKLAALSDWELAFIGDPAQDWALSQGMLTLANQSETIAHYEAVAGFKLNLENLDFYRVWEVWRTIVILNNGLRAFLDNVDTSMARLNLGFGRVKLLEQLLAMVIGKSISDAAEIINQWRKSPYRPESN